MITRDKNTRFLERLHKNVCAFVWFQFEFYFLNWSEETQHYSFFFQDAPQDCSAFPFFTIGVSNEIRSEAK